MSQICFKDMIYNDQCVEEETYKNLGKFFVLFNESMDCFLVLSARVVELAQNRGDLESVEGQFFRYIANSYQQLPNSLHSIVTLMAKGQYYEAIVLYRTLLENLVNCKYLYFHKSESENTLNGERLHLKERWEFVVEMAYDKIYKMLCKFAHKNFGYTGTQTVLNRRFPLEHNHRNTTLPVFNMVQARFLMNHVNFIMYGYLNLFLTFVNSEEKEFEAGSNQSEILKKLARFTCDDEKNFSKAKNWFEMMVRITRLEPRT